MHIRPKDYVVIKEGLFFAVVSDYLEADRVLTFLRYKKIGHTLKKLETVDAGQLIKSEYPEFVFHSQYADIELHGIPVTAIKHVYRPEETVIDLLSMIAPDLKQRDAINMVNLLVQSGIDKEFIGITGSLMLNTHNKHSDIDMVVYGRDRFHKVRDLIKEKINAGKLKELDESMWQDAYQRRLCELGFEEYCAHEKKKYNKCISGQSKVDISMIPADDEKLEEQGPYKKIRQDKIVSRVLNAVYAYDFPARYSIDNNEINEVVSYTATYTGQAEQGQTIEAAGFIEQDCNEQKRLVVGTSREAAGEYIKVIKA